LPLNRPEKLKLPLLSVVVVALAAPLRVTVTAPPFATGAIVPLMLKVGAVVTALLGALETPAQPASMRQSASNTAIPSPT